MTSFREGLLAQAEPLDAHETGILESWLEALRDDVGTFGATAEDESRMAAIEARIAASRAALAETDSSAPEPPRAR